MLFSLSIQAVVSTAFQTLARNFFDPLRAVSQVACPRVTSLQQQGSRRITRVDDRRVVKKKDHYRRDSGTIGRRRRRLPVAPYGIQNR